MSKVSILEIQKRLNSLQTNASSKQHYAPSKHTRPQALRRPYLPLTGITPVTHDSPPQSRQRRNRLIDRQPHVLVDGEWPRFGYDLDMPDRDPYFVGTEGLVMASIDEPLHKLVVQFLQRCLEGRYIYLAVGSRIGPSCLKISSGDRD